MVYYIYILKSLVRNKTYTGSTNDVKRRLAEHNSGKVKSSKAYKPFEVIHKEAFKTEKEAREKEKFFKTSRGRREIKKLISQIR